MSWVAAYSVTPTKMTLYPSHHPPAYEPDVLNGKLICEDDIEHRFLLFPGGF